MQYQCSNCRTFYEDEPGRHGPPVPHPKDECLPHIRKQVRDARNAVTDAEQRLIKALSQNYA